MKIAGLQKMTLLDYPGKVAATVFTGGCNMRCPYCHNARLIDAAGPSEITQEELLSFLATRKGLLDGVCITGGEPLLWKDIDALLAKIKALGFLIKLDTNGSFPARLKALVENAWVDYVAMDVKHAPEKYAQAAGTQADLLPAITESVQYLLSGAIACEFRTTVVKGIHTQDDIAQIGRFLQGADKYFLQNYESSADVLAPGGLQGFDEDELLALASAARVYVPAVQIRGA